MSRVRLRIDKGKLTAVVQPMTIHSVRKAGERTKLRARANIMAANRFGTGKMATEMQVKEIPGQPPLWPKVAVGSPVDYVKYQEFGTRAHGPVKAKFLRFKPKGSSTFVFAKWVRGVTPARFMRKAIDQLRPDDFS